MFYSKAVFTYMTEHTEGYRMMAGLIVSHISLHLLH